MSGVFKLKDRLLLVLDTRKALQLATKDASRQDAQEERRRGLHLLLPQLARTRDRLPSVRPYRLGTEPAEDL